MRGEGGKEKWRSRGRGNHNQNILYEGKNSFPVKGEGKKHNKTVG